MKIKKTLIYLFIFVHRIFHCRVIALFKVFFFFSFYFMKIGQLCCICFSLCRVGYMDRMHELIFKILEISSSGRN